MSKTDLKIRPVYHRLARRIEAHICISFTAYKVLKELERGVEKGKNYILCYKSSRANPKHLSANSYFTRIKEQTKHHVENG